MTLVKAYDMSRLAMIFFAFLDSYANCEMVNTEIGFEASKGTNQEKRKDDTSYEEPTTNFKRDEDTPIEILALVENIV
jgi:hypothetical protein